MEKIKEIALFEGREIRKVWHNEKWYFSISDVVFVLTDSNDVKQYIKKMRERDNELSINWGTICTLLEVMSKDDKKRKENMSNLEGIFRIIQSIPSPKAEPIRLWLARVGTERLEEIQDPELAINRAKETYERKGYPKEWIDKRMRGINVRHSLTDEWKNRGVKKGQEFAILTDEIYKGTFDMTANGYKKHKSLDKEHNLRDHMNDIELILTMLGEATTTKFTQDRDSQEFKELHKDAKDGGGVAGRTRKDIESQTKKGVIDSGNYLSKEQ
ncbi:MAG: Bro-N domain-containing protein, partial [Patescibacteria group bacterium]